MKTEIQHLLENQRRWQIERKEDEWSEKIRKSLIMRKAITQLSRHDLLKNAARRKKD